MKCEWKECVLSDVADIVDSLHKTPKYTEHGIPMLRVTDIKEGYLSLRSSVKVSLDIYDEFTKKHKPEIGDIVISRVGTYGVFSYVNTDERFCLGQNTAIIIPHINTKYLYYFLMSPMVKKYLSSVVTGSTQKTISLKNIKTIPLHIPSDVIQKRIANILSALDDKIECNNKINENLQQQAQAIFESWFIDYEPWGGIMPDNWNEVSLDTVIDFQNGYAFKSKDLLKESFPDTYRVFKQGHINRGGGFNSEGTKSWYLKESARHLEKYVLHKGDVLMAMTDMKNNVAILGNTAIMPIDNEYILNQRVGLLRPKGVYGITYPFIYFLTNSQEFLSDLRSRANSGVQVNLSSTAIKSTKFVLAPKEVNEQFSSITIPMMEMIFRNQNENEKLSHLRDALLPKLMSGEIDVEDVEL